MFRAHCPDHTILAISAMTHQGIATLQDALIERAERLKPHVTKEDTETPVRVYNFTKEEVSDYTTWRETAPNQFIVEGARMEQIVRMTDMSNEEAVARVYDVLEKQNILPRIYRVLESRPEIWQDYLFEGGTKVDAKDLPKMTIAGKEFPLRYNFRKKSS